MNYLYLYFDPYFYFESSVWSQSEDPSSYRMPPFHTISLTQEGYIDRVLERFGMANCKLVGTPIEKDKSGMKGGGDKLCDGTLCLELIGSLGWIQGVPVRILLLWFLTLEGSTRTLMIVTGFVRNGFPDILQAGRSSGSV